MESVATSLSVRPKNHGADVPEPTSNDAINMTEASVASDEASFGSFNAALISFSAFKYHRSAVDVKPFEFGLVPKAANVTAENAYMRAV